MFRWALIPILMFTVALAASPAEAAKYTCKTVDKLARLGARDSDIVVVDPDNANKECRFSVNGEPAGSPPRGAIINALNLLRGGEGSAALSGRKVDWLALLLLAASRSTVIPSELEKLLLARASDLAKCFAALETDSRFSFPSFEDTRGVFCRMLSAGGEVGFSGAHRVDVESETPQLVIGVRHTGEASFLFVPFRLFRGPPLR